MKKLMLVAILALVQLSMYSKALAKVDVSVANTKNSDCLRGVVTRVASHPTQTPGFHYVEVTVRASQAVQSQLVGTLTFSGQQAADGMAMVAAIGKSAVVCKNGSFLIQ